MIKLFVMDVDGTLTDGALHIDNTGKELFKSFHARDGYGIKYLLSNTKSAIITGRTSGIVSYRAEELGITYCYQGITNKLSILKQITNEMNISLDEVAYIGDDVNDLECIEAVKFSGCPKDAVLAIKNEAKFISNYDGGHGAVREFIDFLISIGEIQ